MPHQPPYLLFSDNHSIRDIIRYIGKCHRQILPKPRKQASKHEQQNDNRQCRRRDPEHIHDARRDMEADLTFLFLLHTALLFPVLSCLYCSKNKNALSRIAEFLQIIHPRAGFFLASGQSAMIEQMLKIMLSERLICHNCHGIGEI